MTERDQVLDRQVFTVGGRSFRWREVVSAARAWSDWTKIEERAGLALELRERPALEPDPAEFERTQAEFRYERNLLAADDLEAWLDGWGIAVEDWLLQVRATVVGEGASIPPSPREPDAEQLAAAAWAEAVCSGELERLARTLAERCAVYEAAGNAPPEELTADALALVDEAHQRFRDAAVTDGALERKLHDERLEWTRIEGRYLAHPDEDVVREAALGVREGHDLEEMSRIAGARYEAAARFYLADAETELKARLLAASPGELCGPFRSGEEQWLMEVAARVAPSLEDPELRVRAASEVAEHTVEQQVLQRVRWHERLGG